jgi:hypothetical protein
MTIHDIKQRSKGMGNLTFKSEWKEMKDKLEKTVVVPVWICVVVIAFGAILLLGREKK